MESAFAHYITEPVQSGQKANRKVTPKWSFFFLLVRVYGLANGGERLCIFIYRGDLAEKAAPRPVFAQILHGRKPAVAGARTLLEIGDGKTRGRLIVSNRDCFASIKLN